MHHFQLYTHLRNYYVNVVYKLHQSVSSMMERLCLNFAICSFIQQIFTEYLLWVRLCSKNKHVTWNRAMT